MRRNKRGLLVFVLACGVFLQGIAWSQVYLPPAPPEQPSDYGKVVLNSSTSDQGPGGVVFDHWLHRSKFTCRLCHVDIGFAMQARATGITAETNRQGFHCGACHDGKRVLDGKTIFAACSDAPKTERCFRCHSLGKTGVRKYEYKSYTSKFPKGIYSVNWEAAEESGAIHPVDFLEGVSVKRAPLQNREDFAVKAQYTWVSDIGFSHKKHSVWNGCEVCHPDIFPTTKKGAVKYSMFWNIEGRYCGACHGKVAFPLNNCQGCHPHGPMWVTERRPASSHSK